MGLKRYLLSFFVILLLATVAYRVNADNGSLVDVVADKGPPVDVAARAMLSAAPAGYKEEFKQLVDMLSEVPAEIPVGGTADITRSMGNVTLMLKVYHNELEGKAYGWDFYWYKYWCQGDFEARMPNAIGIRVNEQGEITFFYNALWFNNVEVKGEVNVTREEAVNRALELASSNMKSIGVTGVKSIEATPVLSNEEDTWPKPGTYYPCWSVEIYYDKYYGDIGGYEATIRADTGEVLGHGVQGVYGSLPLPEDAYLHDIQPIQDTSTSPLPLGFVGIVIVFATVLVLPLIACHKLRKLHLQR